MDVIYNLNTNTITTSPIKKILTSVNIFGHFIVLQNHYKLVN